MEMCVIQLMLHMLVKLLWGQWVTGGSTEDLWKHKGRKGLLPSQSFHSPSWTEAVAAGRRPCICRAHRARTLCPSAFQLSPARQEAQGVVHPLWVPGRETGSQAPLSGLAAREHGWGPGPEQLSDTAMTVYRPRAPLS